MNPTDHDPHHTRVVFTRSRSVISRGARRAVTIMRRMSLPGGSDLVTPAAVDAGVLPGIILAVETAECYSPPPVRLRCVAWTYP